jgi:hypothetical protein
MVSTALFYAAAIIALAPTLVLMYVLLRKYTYPYTERPYFSDPTFFLLFAIGLVAGVIMFLVYSYVVGSIVAIIVYSLIQVMLVVVIMNLKRYRGKSDSVFYGLGFGLGAGGSTATGFIYYISSSADMLDGSVDIAGWVLLFVLGMAMLFQYASVGTTVGEGIARHLPMQYAFQAMIYNAVFWIVFTIMLMNSDSEAIMYIMAAAVLAISIFYLRYAYFKEIADIADEVDRQNNTVGKRHRPKLK